MELVSNKHGTCLLHIAKRKIYDLLNFVFYKTYSKKLSTLTS